MKWFFLAATLVGSWWHINTDWYNDVGRLMNAIGVGMMWAGTLLRF